MTEFESKKTNVWLPIAAGVIGAACMLFGAMVLLSLPSFGIAL